MKKILFSNLFVLCAFVLAAQCGGGGGTSGGGGGTASLAAGSTASSFNTSAIVNATNQLRSMQLAMNDQSYANAKLAYSGISGSPYLNEEKVNGYVVLNDGTVIENIPLQYDIYSKDIVAEKTNGEEIALDRRIYKEVGMEIDGQMVVFKKVNPKEKDTFYEVLYESDDIVFYKSHRAIFKEGKDSGITQIEPSFKKQAKHYIAQEDGSVAKVSLKKKKINTFIETFPEVEAVAMREYIKKHKVKFNKEKDFVEMMAAVYSH